jgi:hypothetical protein
MRKIALATVGTLVLAAGALLGATSSRAGDYGYDVDDGPATVVTRRTVVERRVVAPPRRVVREVVVERPVVRPRTVVREVVVERAPAYRPHPRFREVREVVVERDGFGGPRRFGPRAVGYGPDFDLYD